ncbi:threonine ammonia-lyase [Tissierella creatinophila]|uniref:threonine ammonia-lyase n=1 Tax=Tissierella creatinophila DSM 6911 TaxID=1123403 RepID=A0A1U7M909_TISCR|nr:threonine/serine dehydratase [Tissierella creatinophila]OLS03688.1 L-threonine dehydratase catabolic TdcB [Tissierella creatinophila DSM 6911]
MISFNDVEKAKNRIERYVYHTPLEKSIHLSDENTNIYLKLENQQKVRCAKVRGATSKITSLTKEEREKGVVAVSSGNHGAAVSYVSNLLGIEKATVYVPITTPKSKVEKIGYYGAKVVKVGKNYDEAHEFALEKIKEGGGIFIDPCSDKEVIAGQGTIAIEILEEQPDIDTILVPIGGGGIITGISIAAKHINPNIKIIGLQTSACPAMVASLRDEKFYETYPTENSICDALIGGVGYIPYKMAKECIDDIMVIEEEDIADAIKYALLEEKIIVEPAAAIGIAAVRTNSEIFKGENIAVVLTGGNIDKQLLLEIINKDS